MNPNPCRARHAAYPDATLPCTCTQRPQDYMRRPRRGLGVWRLAAALLVALGLAAWVLW